MTWQEFWGLDLIYWSWLGTALLSLNFALIGTTLVEKKLTLIGDSFSHAILPGVVLSTFFWGTSSLSLLIGGFAAGFLLLLLTYWITRSRKVYQDSVFSFLALFFVATGMILSYKTKTSSEILHLLFGQVLAFDRNSVLLSIPLTLISFVFFFFVRRIWSLWILDAAFFSSQNLSRRLVFTLVFVSLSLLMAHLTLGLNSLGAFMTVGLVVIPALISQQLSFKLYTRVFLSALFGMFSTFFGFALSAFFEWPLGPSVIVVLSALYVLVLFLKPALTFSKRGVS